MTGSSRPQSRRDKAIEKYIGEYRRCYLAYAPSPDLRRHAASGGAVTALLVHALRQGHIDGALVLTTPVLDGRVTPTFVIARTVEELISAQGSKYIAVHFIRDALPLIRQFEGRLGVVALPCDSHALRRHCQQEPDLSEKVRFIITLFCGHNSEPALTEMVARRFGGDDRLESITYRTGHWRGNIELTYRNAGRVVKPFTAFSDYQNLYYYCQRKCHQCHDHLGYHGDVAAGDIWSAAMTDHPIKHTSLITRTDVGENLVRDALANGVLLGQEVDAGIICDGQARTLPFHHNVSARSRAGGLIGEKITGPDGQRAGLLETLTALVVLRNERLTRTESGRRRVEKLSPVFVRAALYFFKGLETLLSPLGRQPRGVSARLPAPPPIFTICGATIWGNRGAEAMLVTTAGELRERFPGAHINILSYMPRADRALVSDPDITVLDGRPRTLALGTPFALLYGLLRKAGLKIPRLLPKTLKRMRLSTAVLDVSGISFVDGREMTSLFNALSIILPRLLGVPVFKLAQAMGPFDNPVNRLAARFSLNRCAHVFARGDVTAANLRALGLPDRRWSRASDVALLYRPEYSLSSENEERVTDLVEKLRSLRDQGRQIILLCPSSVVLEKANRQSLDYLGRFIDLIGHLQDDQHHFVIIPNATREGADTLRNNDLPTIETLHQRIRDELGDEVAGRVDRLNYDVNTAALRQITGLGDVMVTSRFHSMISGLLAGIPMVVISWSQKYNEVLADFGLDDFGVDFADPAQDICQRVRDLLRDQQAYRHRMQEALPAVMALSQSQFDFIKGWAGER